MRKFALLCLAVAVGAPVPAAGSAHATGTTTITITAHTANNPIGKLKLVWTTYGKTAQISGNTSDGQAGTMVELQQTTFPFQGDFTAAAQTQTADGGSFSFTTKPTIATRYRVILTSDPSSMSPETTVYVAANWINLPTKPCSGFSCHKHFGNRIVYPAAVAKRESSKRVYFYFGVRYGSQSVPPATVRLVTTGRTKLLHGSTYRAGFSVTFSTVTAYYYEWVICTKDTEAQDGFGLPLRSSCGGHSIPYSVIKKGYIG